MRLILILTLLTSCTEYRPSGKLCMSREGIQIARRIPGGKRRWSKMVLLYHGPSISYGEWIRCVRVDLPFND